VVFKAFRFTIAEMLWLVSCFRSTTNFEAGALTVAGQWRNFTAFPSILTIAVMNGAAPQGTAGTACNGSWY
jgi:hypothetical protein